MDSRKQESITLTASDVYEVLCESLPMQNNFYKTDYEEELQELIDFGVTTKPLLLDLINKHKDAVLSIDKEPLDDFHIGAYSEEYGEDYVKERIEKEFWFAYPALLRIILELEFGNRYRSYSKDRDNL